MNKIITGECLTELKKLPDESVNCIITSPPYYGLRDYGTGHWVGGDPNCPHRRLSKCSDKTITGHAQKELAGNVSDAIYKHVCPLCGAVRVDDEIGLEETPEEYIKKLTDVFRECNRVLAKDGTLWLNIGDSYAYSGKGCGGTKESSRIQKTNRGANFTENKERLVQRFNCKPKDMIGIPWMLAFSLRNDGWYLRQDIIWEKPNPMPESVKDRCTKSHEYIFLLSKNRNYYFDNDSIKEDSVLTGKRNKRDVWRVVPKPIKEAHFATFPIELITPMILAGTKPNGIVLDPFFGSGTVGVVSSMYGRQFIGIELNPDYVKIAEKRINSVQEKMVL